jgi:hypothetical protein
VILVFAILLVASLPSFAFADDWLAVWPSCSIDDASRPSLSLLYPAPGLPAVVHAGEPLFARFRAPAALTPPPGVQQADVLERYVVELSGAALHVGLDIKERHRHVLPVLSLRPDGGDSLVYRARVDIPAYLAPGTYAFALRTPFGTRSAQHVVRVVEARAIPRIARLPSGVLAPPAAAGTWPVDVWLAGETAEAAAREGEAPAAEVSANEPTDAAALASETSDPAPTLLGEGGSLALRVGRELWVRSGCTDDSAFEREVGSVLASEGRTRVAFDPARASAPPSAAELSAPLAFSFQVDRATADNTGAAAWRELSVLLPFASRASVSSGALSFYPATPPTARFPVAKLARWSVPAGQRATLALEPATDRPPLALRPRSARSGQPTQLRVLGAGARAKVAFLLGPTRSAYASRELRTSFSGPLAHPVRAQVFESDGAGEVVQGHLWVQPHRPPNCAIARPGRARIPARAVTAWLLLAIASLVQRRRSAKNARLKPALE